MSKQKWDAEGLQDAHSAKSTRWGISGVAKRRPLQSVTEATEEATRWLWIKRVDSWVAAGYITDDATLCILGGVSCLLKFSVL